MDKPPQGNRWHPTTRKGPLPRHGLPVLVEVDGGVREGFYNGSRGMWFCGERPIYPRCWRPMPQLPKGLRT